MMRKIVVALLLLSGLTASANEYKFETVKGDEMKTRIYTLDNGLKVYLSVNSEKPRIQTYIAVRTGSRNDPAETTGLAHYLEHLMFKGTSHFGTTDMAKEAPLLGDIEQRYERYRQLTDPDERRQAYHEIDSVSQLAAQYFIPNEYDKLMAVIGAEGTNAYTSHDVTCYTENIPSNEVENWARIQSDRFQNMVIRGFHTELEAVYEEYNIGLSRDMNKLYDAIFAKLFPAHPYGTQTTIGTQEHLKNPSIVNIKNYFQHYYVPNNVAICMAGDFNPDEVIAVIDKYFGQWKPSVGVDGIIRPLQQPQFPALKPITSPQDTTVVGQEAAMVWLGWRAEKAASFQNDTLDVIADMLSNGQAGLLDLDLNQTMKVMEAYGGSETLADYSLFILGGVPKQEQTLNEVRELLLGEIEKLKKGEFSDDLLPSVINNKKLEHFRSLESNYRRASAFVDAFINGVKWEDQVERIHRMERMTKRQIVDFANRFFADNYVTVYKQQGVDSTQKKIDKPAITPIPTNRDLVSDFVREVQNTQVEPIHPRFVDFQKDLTVTETKKKLPLLYKKNDENGLFTLAFRYDFGTEADKRYEVAADYLEYLGTKKFDAIQQKQKFYQLACSYSVDVDDDHITITLSGLDENMVPALQRLEDQLRNAQPDQDAYEQMVELILKNRSDSKQDQGSCYSALCSYGIFGEYNSTRNVMNEQQLRETKPQELISLMRQLFNYEHTVLYYGPQSQESLDAVLSKYHQVPGKRMAAVEGRPYLKQTATQNEIWIAPYDAKNIYMRMYHNDGSQWNPERAAVQALFNEYFGSGMNGIVFQELREARGLAYNAAAYYLRPSVKGRSENYFTHIITQNDKMMDCVREFHHILDSLPQSQGAFQIAKESLTKQLSTSRTTKFGVFNAYLQAKKLGIDYDLNQRIFQDLPSLQLQDIVDFEQRQMAGKSYRYLILGDEQELNLEELQKLTSAPIRRVSLEEAFGY